MTQLSGFSDINGRLTPDPDFESCKPGFEPRTDMGLRIYVGLLLLTPKVLRLPFDPQDNAFLSWAHSYTTFHNSGIIIAGSVEHSPFSSIKDFPWWVSPLQGKDFLQLCDDIQQS